MDNNRLIVRGRFMTDVQIQSLVERDRAQMWQQLQHLYSITDPLTFALHVLDTKRDNIFTALLFTSAPDWKRSLKLLQDQFNSEVTNAQQLMQKLINDYDLTTVRNSVGIAQNTLLIAASELNQAINTAIANDDDSRLRQMAERTPSLADAFSTQLRSLSTDHLARDSRADRAGIYIGVRANELEREGITSVAVQWKTIFNELKSNRHKLQGDMLAAWEYFDYKRPHSMTHTEKRQFEQEISRLKRVASSFA